jgi:hypothetical protein
MNIQKYAKDQIALNLIETALTLFFEQGDLFSVITLAGAAEEILGQLLQAKSDQPGLLRLLRPILGVLRPAGREEPGKKRGVSHETDAYLHMDLYQGALFLLGRAVDDYHCLSGALSPNMLRFDGQTRGETP